MKITHIKISNFLILKEVELNPDSRLNIFVGANRQGKTSFNKAFEAAMKGADASVIRHGADKAELQYDIGGFKVHRTITHKAPRLKVTTPDGDIKASPQAFLDGLISDFSFDPIHFMLLDAKEKTKYLREIFKTTLSKKDLKEVEDVIQGCFGLHFIDSIDFTEDGLSILKGIEKNLYDNRAEKKKCLLTEETRLALDSSRLASFNEDDDPGILTNNIRSRIIDVEGRMNDAQSLKKQVERSAKLRERYETVIQKQEAVVNSIDEAGEIPNLAGYEQLGQGLAGRIIELQRAMDAVEKQHYDLLVKIEGVKEMEKEKETANSEIAFARSALESLPEASEIPDMDELKISLNQLTCDLQDNLEAVNKYLENVALFTSIRDRQQGYNANMKELNAITDAITLLRKNIPQAITRNAKMPITGLRFEGNSVFIDDTKMENLSTQEQVQFATSIFLKLNENKPLKAICLDRAESLDDEALAAFNQSIPEDYQIFLTKVHHEGETIPSGSYIVKEGTVEQV